MEITCRKCGQLKVLTEYYPSRLRKHDRICKICSTQQANLYWASHRESRLLTYKRSNQKRKKYLVQYRKAYSIANYVKLRERREKKYNKEKNDPFFKQQNSLNSRRYAANHQDDPEYKLKRNTRESTRRAIRSGKLQKFPCLFCSNSQVEAHHYLGYNKENIMNIQWLCRKHHYLVHSNHYMYNPVQKEVVL